MKIITIVVTFKPNIELLRRTILSIQSQVDNIIIVNNDVDDLQLEFEKNVMILNLGNNYGIAYAQNIGIKKAIEKGAKYILLSDQDTVYPDNYINKFIPHIEEKKAHLFCPVFYDNIKNVFSPIMIKKFKSLPSINEPTFVEHAIASGSIIDVNCFDKVGLMDESLFIDYVDLEFCWRLTYHGYKILTIPDIVINHQLGDGTKKVLNKQFTLRSNMRYYYILRNGLYLSFYCKFLSFFEKICLLKSVISFSCGIFLIKHNFEAVKIIFTAICDGITKKMGKKEF